MTSTFTFLITTIILFKISFLLSGWPTSRPVSWLGNLLFTLVLFACNLSKVYKKELFIEQVGWWTGNQPISKDDIIIIEMKHISVYFKYCPQIE